MLDKWFEEGNLVTHENYPNVLMTVKGYKSIFTKGLEMEEINRVHCVWEDENDRRQDNYFPQEELNLVNIGNVGFVEL